MSEIVGYSDFEREADGRVTAVPQTSSGPGERVEVRVSVERTIERDGQVIAAGEVASSDVPEGEVGAVSFR